MVLHSYIVAIVPIMPSGAVMAKVYLPIDAAPVLDRPGAQWMACLKKHDLWSPTAGGWMRAVLGAAVLPAAAHTFVDRDTQQWTLDFRRAPPPPPPVTAIMPPGPPAAPPAPE